MKIPLDRSRPIVPQIISEVASRAESGELSAGFKVPSVRKLAQDLGVAPMTVVKAFDELRARGILRMVRGSGTVIAGSLPANLPSMPQFGADAEVIDMSRSVPDPSLEALPEVFPHIEAALRTSPSTRTYVSDSEVNRFSTTIADWLSGEGFATDSAEIVPTLGSTHGRSIALEALTLPGDRVAVEVPGRRDALTWVRELRRLPVPVGRFGGEIDLEAVENALRRGTRLIMLAPDIGSTNGDCLSDRCRERLASLVAAAGAILVEDRSYARLHYESTPPPVASLERSSTVIVDSFSFCASPGLRLGYLQAKPEVAHRLAEQIRFRDRSGVAMLQEGVAEWIESGGLERHLLRIRPEYQAKHQMAVEALEEGMPAGVHWSSAEGGFSLWISLPAGSFVGLTDAALRQGVAIAPGGQFVDRDGDYGFRLSFGALPKEKIREGVQRLAGIVRASLGPSGANSPSRHE